jgi:hypothetical protein
MSSRNKNNAVGLRPYTKTDLSELYGMSIRSFYTLLKPYEEELGPKLGRYYSIKQVEIIFENLGLPPSLLKDEYELQPKDGSFLKPKQKKRDDAA